MKLVNFNLVGKPTDIPHISPDSDSGLKFRGEVSGNRVQFNLSGSAGGATVYYGGRSMRLIIPPTDGSWEADMPPVKPPEATEPMVLVYGSSYRWEIRGDRVFCNDEEWKLKGSTDFRIGDLYFNNNAQFHQVMQQRKTAGANMLRMLCMKANNTGWSWMLDPTKLPELLDAVEQYDMLLLVCVFADTAALMPFEAQQMPYYSSVWMNMQGRPHWLQLCNEWNHPTQKINPGRFAKVDGLISCHGSGLTDADPVQPRWDVAFYHARRDHLPDARGITNCCCYEFQARYPQECPKAPGEGLKPQDYSFRTDVAELMGRHAGMGFGGIFHADAGVNGELWNDAEVECAKAFYRGVER